MKKIMMTLAAVLCCAMISTVFIACSVNDDNPVDPGNNEENWNPNNNVFPYTHNGQTLYYRLKTDSLTKQTYAICSYPTLTPTTLETLWDGYEKPVGDVEIPGTVVYNGHSYPVLDIGRCAFIYCDEITNVAIPEGVFKLGNGVFAYCSALQSVSLPSTLVTIDDYAFYLDSLMTEITIPQNVTTLGHSAFRTCTRLASVTLPDEMTSIGKWCFADDSLLTAITLPVGIDSIGEGTFYNCKGLTAITVPEGVKTIGNTAFTYCPGLKTIKLPQSLTEIGEFVFYGSEDIEAITLASTTPPSVLVRPFTSYNATLYVPVGTIDLYRQHSLWGKFANIVEGTN